MIDKVEAGKKYHTCTPGGVEVDVLAVGEREVFIKTGEGHEELYSLTRALAWWTEVLPFFEVGQTYRYKNGKFDYIAYDIVSVSVKNGVRVAKAIERSEVTLSQSSFPTLEKIEK